MDKKEIELKTKEGWLLTRIIMEVAGKPKKHVEDMLKDYLSKIETENAIILKKEINRAKKQEGDIYASFAELEIIFKDLNELVYFCFDYMPSSVEVYDPQEMSYKARDLTAFINNLQAKLHDVNFAAKTIKAHNVKLNESFTKLLKNFVAVSCINGRTIQELEKIIGVPAIHLETIIKVLESEQRIKKKEDKYVTLK